MDNVTCSDCGGPIGNDKGPPEGWQLEDGRTVCHACCVRVTDCDVDWLTLQRRMSEPSRPIREVIDELRAKVKRG